MVCEFVGLLGKSQPTISHHVKILSEAGLVTGDQRGKWVWYSLNRDRLAELQGNPSASGRRNTGLHSVTSKGAGHDHEMTLNRSTPRSATATPVRPAPGDENPCCGPNDNPPGVVSSNLYGQTRPGPSPNDAVTASLGCGNPALLADLQPGEVVLDLGSGGGIDVFLSARRVGPDGPGLRA